MHYQFTYFPFIALHGTRMVPCFQDSEISNSEKVNFKSDVRKKSDKLMTSTKLCNAKSDHKLRKPAVTVTTRQMTRPPAGHMSKPALGAALELEP